MTRKRGYFVENPEAEFGIAVVASTAREAKKLGFKYLSGEDDVEYIDVRVTWKKDASVADLPIGIIEDHLTGLKRGIYGFVETEECEVCHDNTIVELHDGVVICGGCLVDKKLGGCNMTRKRGYYVYVPEDDGVSIAVVETSARNAKKVGYKYLNNEYDVDFLDVRVMWKRDANVDGLPVGIEKNYLTGLKRGIYGFIYGRCEKCDEETYVAFEEGAVICGGCFADAGLGVA